ncbi:MAG: divalent-cation tolerance protein CutA [Pararhodobacter sp.]|nr:divalent-cation tolerance protein CutA [Pararhodobacter sp.]
MTLREDSGEEVMIEVEVNCPDAEVARRIARDAVQNGLAACANILPGVESIYLWQGRIEAEPEVALRLKSRRTCFDALCALITRLHPYDLPAIIALPVLAANPGYGEWLHEGTGGQGG